ncbi:hypothetical protein NMY22_g16280 [Coprinellus aureogranulatus]|nr:hypothetical protein NMY22_g16280 [Coprinellus aureogranulatus]
MFLARRIDLVLSLSYRSCITFNCTVIPSGYFRVPAPRNGLIAKRKRGLDRRESPLPEGLDAGLPSRAA